MIPEKNFYPGWPKKLTDEDGHHYTRVRDVKESDFMGHSALYLRDHLDSRDTDLMYTPTIATSEGHVEMAGGPFMSPETCRMQGVPETVLPEGLTYG